MEDTLKTIPIFFFWKSRKGFNLSLERVLQLIKRLGFSRVEAEVYVHLAKAGPKSSKDIAEGLNFNPQQLHLVLKSLQDKGAVKTSRRRTILFSALAFEELLASFVETNINQAQVIQKTKQDLLASWQEMVGKNGN
jgi:sugar-specific transcriptional regulator TrmB